MNQEDSEGNGVGDACNWQQLFQIAKAELDACRIQTTSTTTAPATKIELSTLDAVPYSKQVILKWQTEYRNKQCWI